MEATAVAGERQAGAGVERRAAAGALRAPTVPFTIDLSRSDGGSYEATGNQDVPCGFGLISAINEPHELRGLRRSFENLRAELMPGDARGSLYRNGVNCWNPMTGMIAPVRDHLLFAAYCGAERRLAASDLNRTLQGFSRLHHETLSHTSEIQKLLS